MVRKERKFVPGGDCPLSYRVDAVLRALVEQSSDIAIKTRPIISHRISRREDFTKRIRADIFVPLKLHDDLARQMQRENVLRAKITAKCVVQVLRTTRNIEMQKTQGACNQSAVCVIIINVVFRIIYIHTVYLLRKGIQV